MPVNFRRIVRKAKPVLVKDNLEPVKDKAIQLVDADALADAMSAKDSGGVVDTVKEAQVLLRCTVAQRDSWREAAAEEGVSVSEWFRDMGDLRAANVLGCSHPREGRKVYPWASFCGECGLRLMDSGKWLIPEVLR